jgi:hypothetical protein
MVPAPITVRQVEISIDPATGNLLNVDGNVPRTFIELQQIKPPCPRCGTRISVIPIPIESLEGSGPTQLYQFGRHQFNCNCY